ncbi:MAG: hypothetical protein WDA59_08920 [Methanofastidiosum sp.]
MSNVYLKKLLNSKVIGVKGFDIYFDNGYVLNCHEYETYLSEFSREDINNCDYYSPKYFNQ